MATFYKREYGVELNPKTEVAILFGGKAGLVELPICFTNPGDTILVRIQVIQIIYPGLL